MSKMFNVKKEVENIDNILTELQSAEYVLLQHMINTNGDWELSKELAMFDFDENKIPSEPPNLVQEILKKVKLSQK